MASAVRRLGSLSMARGCARIDAGPDTAKIGSADRVQVHHARLIAVIGVRKTYPHGLGLGRVKTNLRGALSQGAGMGVFQATIAAISGLIPMMFIARVRL
jgi:hypothetical protein